MLNRQEKCERRKIDQALLLEKILSGTEEISKEGKRRAVFTSNRCFAS